VLAGLIAFRNSFSGALVFDDRGSIEENLSIRQFGSAWSPPNQSGVGGRPMANLSFALNYAMSGLGVWSYHILNLGLHLLAAGTLFAIVRRTLLQPVLRPRFGADALPLALTIAVLWTVHPVQTQVVTYLSQRTEALMGLFYLLTLFAFIRGTEPGGEKTSRRWLGLSVVSCLLGALCKETIVTAPVMVLLYDRTFVAGNFREAWIRRWRFYLMLGATWIVLGLLMLGLSQRGVGYGHGVSAFEYALTECRALLIYLRVALWPHPLVFDYGMEVFRQVGEAAPYVVMLAPLLVGTLVALRWKPVLGFAACWFFIILSPTSSIVPVYQQPIAESRLYLPLAAVLAVAVLGLHRVVRRRGLVGWIAVAVALGGLTIQRNALYRNEETFWIETVAQRPQNARAQNNLGAVVFKSRTGSRGDCAFRNRRAPQSRLCQRADQSRRRAFPQQTVCRSQRARPNCRAAHSR